MMINRPFMLFALLMSVNFVGHPVYSQSIEALKEQWAHNQTICQSEDHETLRTVGCQRVEQISIQLKRLGFSYGCGGEFGGERYWRNDCSENVITRTKTSPLLCGLEQQTLLNNSSMSIKCDVVADEVKIDKIIVNRGNCNVTFLGFGFVFKFGNQIAFSPHCQRILEYTITVNGTEYSWKHY